ncbi:hypothetical protein TNCV_3315761 [Trichonephila clavipes]|nr:hypothetical protein TNCV_3315761 [Trichonephila clavipes]
MTQNHLGTQGRANAAVTRYGRGRLVFKVSDHGWFDTSSSPVPLKTCRVGKRFTLNLSRAETSSRWCGVHSSQQQHSYVNRVVSAPPNALHVCRFGSESTCIHGRGSRVV